MKERKLYRQGGIFWRVGLLFTLVMISCNADIQPGQAVENRNQDSVPGLTPLPPDELGGAPFHASSTPIVGEVNTPAPLGTVDIASRMIPDSPATMTPAVDLSPVERGQLKLDELLSDPEALKYFVGGLYEEGDFGNISMETGIEQMIMTGVVKESIQVEVEEDEMKMVILFPHKEQWRVTSANEGSFFSKKYLVDVKVDEVGEIVSNVSFQKWHETAEVEIFTPSFFEEGQVMVVVLAGAEGGSVVDISPWGNFDEVEASRRDTKIFAFK